MVIGHISNDSGLWMQQGVTIFLLYCTLKIKNAYKLLGPLMLPLKDFQSILFISLQFL